MKNNGMRMYKKTKTETKAETPCKEELTLENLERFAKPYMKKLQKDLPVTDERGWTEFNEAMKRLIKRKYGISV